MSTTEFNPNQVTFDEGLQCTERAVESVGLAGDRVLTSQDEDVAEAARLLTVSAVPGGVQEWQLPPSLKAPSQLFITVADPGIDVSEDPAMKATESDSSLAVASSSNDRELVAGD